MTTDKKENNMKCAAFKVDSTELCGRDHKSGCTHQGPDGWVYFLCGQHDKMIKEGKMVELYKSVSRGHAPDQPQLDMNSPVQAAWHNKEKDPINLDNAITTVFITGRYNGPDRETDAGIKVLVHGKYDLVGYDSPQLAIDHAWEIFVADPDHTSTVAINHALIRMADGTKRYCNIVFDHDGVPRWVLVTKEVTKQYILVTNWEKCPRCSGRGEVSYGNWSRYDSRLHRSARVCFHCHGTGYRGAQG